MSLVRGLEEKQARDKEIYISGLTEFLRSNGVEASFHHEPVQDLYDAVEDIEPVVRIAGWHITRIVLRSRLFASCGLWQNISFFDYEAPLELGADSALRGKLKARVKPVIQGRTLGLFGGKVTSVRWTGGKLAELLNEDSDLLHTLLSTSSRHGYPDIMVQFKDDSIAEISGPQFDSPPPFLLDVLSHPTSPAQNDALFHAFKLYNSISRHLERLVDPEL